MRKWENYGDVNFLTYGGSLIRPAWTDEELTEHPSLKNQYEVLMLSRLAESETNVFIGLKVVDTDDYEDKREEISEMYDVWSVDDPLLFAVSCAEYTGLEPSVDTAYRQKMYSTEKDFVIDEADAAEWLRELGVPEEWIN